MSVALDPPFLFEATNEIQSKTSTADECGFTRYFQNLHPRSESSLRPTVIFTIDQGRMIAASTQSNFSSLRLLNDIIPSSVRKSNNESSSENTSWDQLLQAKQRQVFLRWYSKLLFEPYSSQTDPATMIRLLAKASSRSRNKAFRSIVSRFSPSALLIATLEGYEQSGEERYLLQAVSLLESVGDTAWPALVNLSLSGRSECELFVGLIARLPGPSSRERVSAMLNLSKNPNRTVRFALFEVLSFFSDEERRQILTNLVSDTDVEILEYAKESLAEMA